jgi:hypothetical protein
MMTLHRWLFVAAFSTCTFSTLPEKILGEYPPVLERSMPAEKYSRAENKKDSPAKPQCGGQRVKTKYHQPFGPYSFSEIPSSTSFAHQLKPHFFDRFLAICDLATAPFKIAESTQFTRAVPVQFALDSSKFSCGIQLTDCRHVGGSRTKRVADDPKETHFPAFVSSIGEISFSPPQEEVGGGSLESLLGLAKLGVVGNRHGENKWRDEPIHDLRAGSDEIHGAVLGIKIYSVNGGAAA